MKLSCRPLAFTSYKAVQDTKRGLELSPCHIFFIISKEKYLFCFILLTDKICLSTDKMFCLPLLLVILDNMCTVQGRIQRFGKGAALYIGHHGWPTKKILAFRWSKKTKITLETISFGENISISIFKFSPFLYMKACPSNLINFSKFANALERKEKKYLGSSQ